MPKITIDPEGGNPTGAPQIGNNTKQANEEPEQIPMEQPSADTTGAIPRYKERGK